MYRLSDKIIGVGCLVVVKTIDGGQRTFQIVDRKESVGTDEDGTIRITPDSPFGQALIGRKVDADIHVVLPNGKTLDGKVVAIHDPK